MTDSKPPEGAAVDGSSASSDPTPETVPTGSPPPEAPAASAQPAPDDEEGRESIEVEAVDSKPKPVAAGTHRPPPPPSIRASGGRWHFDVQGRPKLAQDLMTRKIFTIGPNDKLLHLEEHMEKFRFGHLPVVEDDKLVGLITHADLLHASASFLTQKAKEIDEIVHSFPASRIMKRDIVKVRPTDSLADVAKVMWESKVGCVLVTDDSERLVGIITEGDFIRLAHHFLMEDQK
jgi:CBS domain-containing protein